MGHAMQRAPLFQPLHDAGPCYYCIETLGFSHAETVRRGVRTHTQAERRGSTYGIGISCRPLRAVFRCRRSSWRILRILSTQKQAPHCCPLDYRLESSASGIGGSINIGATLACAYVTPPHSLLVYNTQQWHNTLDRASLALAEIGLQKPGTAANGASASVAAFGTTGGGGWAVSNGHLIATILLRVIASVSRSTAVQWRAGSPLERMVFAILPISCCGGEEEAGEGV